MPESRLQRTRDAYTARPTLRRPHPAIDAFVAAAIRNIRDAARQPFDTDTDPGDEARLQLPSPLCDTGLPR